MMFNREYGKYGSLILPINFALLTFIPVFVLAWFMFLVGLAFVDLGFAWIVWAAIGVVFVLALAFFRRFLLTFLEFEYSLLTAIYQVIFTSKTHDKIDKVDSTRRLM